MRSLDRESLFSSTDHHEDAPAWSFGFAIQSYGHVDNQQRSSPARHVLLRVRTYKIFRARADLPRCGINERRAVDRHQEIVDIAIARYCLLRLLDRKEIVSAEKTSLRAKIHDDKIAVEFSSVKA